MRFKLVLSVQTELSGNILPVSYQYELSSCVHRILTEDRGAYEPWVGTVSYTHMTLPTRLVV